MYKSLIQLMGWYGVIAILTAYVLISFSIADAESLLYQILNLSGALGIILETYSKRDLQPLVINIFWLLIALIAMLRNLIL